MKIEAHIIAVKSQGNELAIEAQGRIGKAEWAAWRAFTVLVPLTDTARRVYYVGRKIEVQVTPK